MFKSYVDCLYRATKGLLEEAIVTYPQDRRGFERDLVRISFLVEHRGLPLFTMDFPALLKHFDKCLSEGTYTRSGLPAGRSVNNGVPVPRLFQGLILRVFDKTGQLKSAPDINCIAFIRQLYAIGKKVSIECKKEKVYETISDFYQVEELLPAPSLTWDGDRLDIHNIHNCHLDNYDERMHTDSTNGHESGSLRVSRRMLDVAQRTCDILASTLGVFDPYEWKLKHGPGAVSDLCGKEFKYFFPTWTERLESVFPYADFAFANHGAWADARDRSNLMQDLEPASKLITVPKTQKGPRLIASEPVSHQWCQQALKDFLDSRCSNTWINNFIRFHDQSFNQEGARLASMDGSWTVDLSAASDRVTTRFIERLFRNNTSLISALYATRTRYLDQEIDRKWPNRIKLKKFSTMGSACTFPVETIGFLAIALSSCLISQGKEASIENIRALTGKVRIFGDDIIIPKYAGETLEVLLSYLSFEVNQSKTHRNGRFRESCGLEVYDGVDVTPAYIRRVPDARRPESIASVVESSNNFFMKGWWRAAEAIKSTVQLQNIVPVSADSGLFGWKTFTPNPQRYRTRWNDLLHRYEYRTLKLVSKVRKRPVNDFAALLQYFTEDPDPLCSWESGVVLRPKTKLVLGWEPLYV